MNQITFSHKYFKLNWITCDNNNVTPVKQACLVNVSIVNKKDLPQKFIDYDATYPNGQYELPYTKYLLLLFVTKNYQRDEFVFTTLRPYKPQKEEYYRSLIGQEFSIIIKES
ncbi:MAG: hypothetical protein V1709_00940 [Planctomycetota bacterium]